MALFTVGATVILADTNARGVVVEVKPARRGRQIYRVSFSDGIIDVLEPDLEPISMKAIRLTAVKVGCLGHTPIFPKSIRPLRFRIPTTVPYRH